MLITWALLNNASYFGFSIESAMDEHEDFKVFHRYDDSITFKLIGAVCKVLGTSIRGGGGGGGGATYLFCFQVILYISNLFELMLLPVKQNRIFGLNFANVRMLKLSGNFVEM